MTRDPIGSNLTPDDAGDERLAGLVRATAEEWTLPPQRLDQATWRDRVGASGAPRRRGWLPRLAGPLSAAVVVTVVVAFAAVWLNAPRSGPIAGASASPSAASSPSPKPTRSTVPNAIVTGALPDPASVLVSAGEDYRIADLAKGTLGPSVFGAHTGPTAVVARPGGGWLCVCGDWSGSNPARPARITVTLALADATGALESETQIRDLSGRVDPNLPSDAQSELADAHATISSDGRFAFLGWAVREGAEGWKLGIDVIDVTAGRVVGSSGLPVLGSATDDGRPITRIAPEVDLAPSGGAVLVSDFWFVGGEQEQPPSGVDHWSASFDGTTVTGATPAGSTPGDACIVLARGVVDRETAWTLCSTDGRIHFDRFGRDGTPIDSAELPASDGLPKASVDSQGKNLYVWGPVSLKLSRVELASGTVTSVSATAAATRSDPVWDLAHALGRWIAPPALAKIMLEPAVVISPDGTRIYALGVDMANGEASGSRGVFVFDANTLEQVGHWEPTADLTSIAISPDGAWLYAAGQPGNDVAGVPSQDAASITVYATADGSVHVTAARLGGEQVSFPGSVLP